MAKEHAWEYRRIYERRVSGSPPADSFGEYIIHREQSGWKLSGPRNLDGALEPRLFSPPVYRDGEATEPWLLRLWPEAVEYRFSPSYRQWGPAGDTFTYITVALSLTPFITAISTSLGNKAADQLTKGFHKAAKRLIKHRSRTAKMLSSPTLGHVDVKLEMRVEGTRIRIELPRPAGKDLLATCIFMLSQMEFGVFGDCRTILWWREGTWHAAAAIPDQEPVALIWNAEDQAWQPLQSEVMLPLPRRADDGANGTGNGA